jgi:hypothetical protein
MQSLQIIPTALAVILSIGRSCEISRKDPRLIYLYIDITIFCKIGFESSKTELTRKKREEVQGFVQFHIYPLMFFVLLTNLI